MNKNMGLIDRIVRTLFAIGIGILYFKGLITGLAAIILGIFAVVFILTSAVGFCPLYKLFGISTNKSDKQ